MTCSFTADTDGYVYDLPGARDIPPTARAAVEPGPGRGSRTSSARRRPRPTARASRRTACGSASRSALPDDPHLHTALLGFATDWTGIGGRPLHLDGDTTGMVSLDHAAWFHRPARADEWLFYDVHSLVNAGGRGLLRGVMRDARRAGRRLGRAGDAAHAGRTRLTGRISRAAAPTAACWDGVVNCCCIMTARRRGPATGGVPTCSDPIGLNDSSPKPVCGAAISCSTSVPASVR